MRVYVVTPDEEQPTPTICATLEAAERVAQNIAAAAPMPYSISTTWSGLIPYSAGGWRGSLTHLLDYSTEPERPRLVVQGMPDGVANYQYRPREIAVLVHVAEVEVVE